MTALLALVAVLVALPVPARQRLEPALVPAETAGQRRAQVLPPLVLVPTLVLAAAVGLLLTAVPLGARPAVLVASAALVLLTALRLARLRAERAAAARMRAAVAEACAALAGNLRTGMVPARALATAAESCPVLQEARQTMALGGDVTAVWRRQAGADGLTGLRDLARAWQLGTRTGASLTGTLDEVTRGLQAEVALRAVVGSELAAPRATGRVMAALPALGLGLGYLLGGDPVRWLLAGPAGWACLLAGTLLACAGVLWIEALARRATAQG